MTKSLESKAYDVIVVGAGSSGCVLAARLSENPSRRVLLVEAGPHYRQREDWPQELLRANTFAATLPGQPYNWSFMGTLLAGRNYPIPRGKVVGGSSAVNGTYFIRGRPEDFDTWAALGNPSWSYDRVLPSFMRCEHDLDMDDALHGLTGPVPIQRARPEHWRPVTHAFVDACRSLGFPAEPDKNGRQAPGVGAIPRNCMAGVRMNTAITHLQPALERPNLTVLSGAFVRRVLFSGSRAVGVEAKHAGGCDTWHADEIVLCAGGIKSPHLLMVSGIGCANELRAHGIPPVLDNPNVGRHIMDHSTITVPFRIRGDGQSLPDDFMPIQACLNHTTKQSLEPGESQISCVAGSLAMLLRKPQARSLGAALWERLVMLRQLRGLSLDFLLSQLRIRDDLQLNCSLMLPQSKGRLSLASGDPHVPPAIDLNYLATEPDRRAVRANIRTAAALLRQPAMRQLGARRTSLSDAELEGDALLDTWINANMGTAFHTSCGARMGPVGDPLAVVDEFGRVHGAQSLRVADLSIAPVIVRRGTSATAVMIGEHVATFFD